MSKSLQTISPKLVFTVQNILQAFYLTDERFNSSQRSSLQLQVMNLGSIYLKEHLNIKFTKKSWECQIMQLRESKLAIF